MVYSSMFVCDSWRMLEDLHDHCKMIIKFKDLSYVIIDNANEQKYLRCFVAGSTFFYTHIESFIADFEHMFTDIVSLETTDCVSSKKRHRTQGHCKSKKPRVH